MVKNEIPYTFMNYRQEAEKLLKGADVAINGDRPWDITVHDERFYTRVFRDGSLGLGESYMDGWWDSPQLDEMICKILRARLETKVTGKLLMHALTARLMNLQSPARAFEVGEKHYDIGNELYERMLDARMVYTCGYWKDATTLDEAQDAKLDLVCRKIGLKTGDRVLDIGCGWGSFARYASEKYGAHVTGVTVSREQMKLAQERCAGLPVEILLQDYRDIAGTFDHVVSLGMFEHVGYKNYRAYMEVASRVLKDDGFFLLHTIGSLKSVRSFEPWLGKYIFPNAMLPSVAQIAQAVEELFVIEDWHNFGADYDTTLMAWYANIEAHWPELSGKYDERFHRMWKYYLLSCAGSFRARKNQLWQVVLSKKGVVGGYQSIR